MHSSLEAKLVVNIMSN